MQNKEAVQPSVELFSVINAGTELPQYVFFQPFKNFLFFDTDISSSDVLIFAVQEIVKTCFGLDSQVEVFSCSSRTFLGRLDATENWPDRINKISKTMRDTGDCGGLILLEASNKWAVYQKIPIDVGVFAFNSNENLQGAAALIDDCFFDHEDIKDWLSCKSQRDIDLVNSLGHNYLAALITNYF